MKVWLRRTVQLILTGLASCLLSLQPALAQSANPPQVTPPLHVKEDNRPPEGFVRPPIFIKPEATTSPKGVSPVQIRNFYGIPASGGAGVTIAIVDAYNNPNIENDLNVFSTQFGLPACTTANGCFKKVPGSGTKLPRADQGWALEIALDVQWAHAIAPDAKILLVEAASNSLVDLTAAVDKAVSLGATVVSMSWGGREFSSETNYDSHFNKPGVAFFASSGDSGTGPEYPAVSPYVISVGGTTVNMGTDGTYKGETAWSGSGGGVSLYESKPSSQQCGSPDLCGSQRGNPDVAYNADPNTGFAVYDSYGYQGRKGWFQVGGTSAGSPQWAALFAIANAQRATPLTGLGPVYAIGSDSYHDITVGTNGTCGPVCNAGPGYDLVTGLGSPTPNLVNNLKITP